VEFNTCLNLTTPQFVTSTNPKPVNAKPVAGPRQRFGPPSGPAQAPVPGFRPAPGPRYCLPLFSEVMNVSLMSFDTVSHRSPSWQIQTAVDVDGLDLPLAAEDSCINALLWQRRPPLLWLYHTLRRMATPCAAGLLSGEDAGCSYLHLASVEEGSPRTSRIVDVAGEASALEGEVVLSHLHCRLEIAAGDLTCIRSC
jgi:hypothetical protein